MHIGKKNWSILLILSIVSHALPLQADNIKADSLIQKAKLVKYTNPKQSAYFAQQALELLPVKSPDTRRAQALLAYGVACKFLGDFDI